jgi:hypothetical protein
MGNRESSPPIQPCDEILASFTCSANISNYSPNRSVSPLQLGLENNLTPVLEEDRLEEIHIDVSAQIITEQMLIEIYKENQAKKQNDNIRVVKNNNQKICSNQNKENVSPSNVILPNKSVLSGCQSKPNQSLLSFIFNGLGPRIR